MSTGCLCEVTQITLLRFLPSKCHYTFVSANSTDPSGPFEKNRMCTSQNHACVVRKLQVDNLAETL
jgi:hypothetical protein